MYLKIHCVFRLLLWGNNFVDKTNSTVPLHVFLFRGCMCASVYSQARLCRCAPALCSCTLQVHPEIYIKEKTHKKAKVKLFTHILSKGCKTKLRFNIKTTPCSVSKSENLAFSTLLFSFAKSWNFICQKDTHNYRHGTPWMPFIHFTNTTVVLHAIVP